MWNSTMRHHVQKFCRDTDIHGVKLLHDESISRLQKTIWSIIIVAAFVLLTCLFYYRVAYFLDREVTTKVSTDHGEVFLPSVRICFDEHTTPDVRKLTAEDILFAPPSWLRGTVNLNRTAVLGKEKKDERRRKRKETKDEETYIREEAVAFFKNFSLDPKIEEQEDTAWFTMGDPHLPVNWAMILQTLISHGADKPLTAKYKFNASELLYRAQYDYTANMTCKMLRDVNATRVTEDCNDGRWFQVPENFGGMCLVRQQNDTDRVVSFERFELYRELSTYIHATTKHQKHFLILEPDLEPLGNVLSRGILSATTPGYLHNIRVARKTSTNRIQNCVQNERYSAGTCVRNCIVDRWFEEFECNMITMDPLNTSLPVCPHTTQYDPRYSQLEYSCRRGCPRPCKTAIFVISTVELLLWVDPEVSPTVFFLIYPDEMTEVMEISELELYPVGSLLGELGGTMGLLMGVSVLSIAHFVWFVGCNIVTMLRRNKNEDFTHPGDFGDVQDSQRGDFQTVGREETERIVQIVLRELRHRHGEDGQEGTGL